MLHRGASSSTLLPLAIPDFGEIFGGGGEWGEKYVCVEEGRTS